jgi:hypothetical protein
VRDSKGITLRNGWGRDWPVRSDEFVPDLLGERGREEEEPPAALGERGREEKKQRRRWSGWARARAPHLSGCVAPVASAPHRQVWRPWGRRHTSSLAKRLSPRGFVSQYVWAIPSACVAPLGGAPHMLPRRMGAPAQRRGGHVGWVSGAGRRGATWACVAPVGGAPHKRVRLVK